MSSNRSLLASYVQGIQAPRNFILNPKASKNIANVTDADGIVSRDTTNTLDGVSSFLINADASGEKALFLASPFTKEVQGKNCEAKFDYFGDGSLYKAYVQTDSTKVSSEQQLTNVTSGTQSISFNFPCYTSGSAVPAIVIEATSASAAAFNVGNLYIGEATNIGSAAQAEVVVRATGTPSNTINGTNPTIWGTESLDLYGEYNNTNGIFTAKRDGQYCWAASVEIDGIKATNNYITFAAKKNGISLPGLGLQRVANASLGTISITSSNCVNLSINDTLEFVVATNIGTPVFNSSEVNALSITRFPTASKQVFRVGAPGLELTSYTPTNTDGFGTISSPAFQYQCIGNNLYISASFVSGTVTASTARIEFPAGFTAAGTPGKRIQVGNITRAGAAGPYTAVTVQGRTYLTFGTGAGSQGDVGGSTLVGSSEPLLLTALVPVTADSPCPRTPMPLLKNAVTTESDSVVRLAFGRLAAPSACTIQNGSVGFASVSSSATGECSVVFTKAFSQVPSCTCNMRNATVFDAVYCRITALSTTGITTRLLEGTTPRNEPVVITCMGSN